MTVPTIDLSGWWSGDRASRSAIARELDRAARTVGFTQVVGHRVPPNAIAGLTRALDAFFGLPLHVKERATSPHAHRGYRTAHGPVAGSYEAFEVGVSVGEFPHLDLDPTIYADNPWPAGAHDVEMGIAGWFRAVAGLARTLESVVELALGLPDGFMEPYTDHSADVLRLVKDGAGAPGDDGVGGADGCTDRGLLSVRWADPVVGLQVLDPAGDWRSVVPQPGVLLVNVGDLLARWTNDRWRSPTHREIPPRDARGRSLRRRSAVFLHAGNADAVMSTLPTCRDATGHSLDTDVTVAEPLAQPAGNWHAARGGSRIGPTAA